jgi:hypothetical protein
MKKIGLLPLKNIGLLPCKENIGLLPFEKYFDLMSTNFSIIIA